MKLGKAVSAFVPSRRTTAWSGNDCIYVICELEVVPLLHQEYEKGHHILIQVPTGVRRACVELEQGPVTVVLVQPPPGQTVGLLLGTKAETTLPSFIDYRGPIIRGMSTCIEKWALL